MIFHDNDLILPFEQAVVPDPYHLPFRMGRFPRLHQRFIMAAENASIPAWKIAPRKYESMLDIFSRHPYAYFFDELQHCVFTEGDLAFDLRKSKSVRQDTLKWLADLNSQNPKSIENLAFTKAKLVEIMKEMSFHTDIPSDEEFITLFRQALELTLDVASNAKKILGVLDIVDELENHDINPQEFYEDPSRTEQEREAFLQAVHEKHAKKWHFKPARVFIGDIEDYGEKGAEAIALRREPQNQICMNRDQSLSYVQVMNNLFHEGTHIYQFDLIEMLEIVFSHRFDFKSGLSVDKNEAEFIKAMKEIFPYQEGNLFHEVLYDEDVRNYALICLLGALYYNSSEEDAPEKKKEAYHYNPLEVLAMHIGRIVEKHIENTCVEERKKARDKFEFLVRYKTNSAIARDNLFSSMFVSEVMRPA